MKLANGSVLRFEEILSRHHGLIGRGTCVIRASVVNPPADWKPVVAGENKFTRLESKK